MTFSKGYWIVAAVVAVIVWISANILGAIIVLAGFGVLWLPLWAFVQLVAPRKQYKASPDGPPPPAKD